MTKFLSSISFIILSVFSLQANENSALFDNSNEQYLQENYEQAIVGYLLLEKEGFCSFNLHFNSGNAYFELADWKNAILQYERALLHQPNSKKAIHNLEIAISHTADKMYHPQFNNTHAIWLNLAAKTTSSTWAKMTVFYLILTCVLGVLFYFTRKQLFSIGMVLLFAGFIISFLLAKTQYGIENDKSNVILFSEETSIKDAPSSEAQEIFLLHSGTKAKVIDQVDDWVLISLPNQESGWSQKDNWVEI